MIQTQIIKRGITDTLVLQAMEAVPRHMFVPPDLKDRAYEDNPLPIGHDQTISQPYIVAYMLEALQLKGGEKVLEIGTGSGYGAAVLSRIADSVFSIEIICELEKSAAQVLRKVGYHNVSTRCGDGYLGWEEHMPFDAIVLTASPPKIPETLIAQLKMGGVLVAPVGKSRQKIVRITKTPQGLKKENLIAVRFVPMTGKAQKE